MINRSFSSITIAFLCTLFSATSVHAATYYISGSGSSSAACSSGATCTFSRAQSIASSGDTIEIVGTIAPIIISKAGLTLRGGKVDGSSVTTQDSAAVIIDADNITLSDIEITNGWSYGFRTSDNIKNTTGTRLNIHHNVRENFISSGGCNPNNTHGWGGAMRAYYADGMNLTDTKIWENCGEGFSAVMSKNIHGNNLTLWDNWSVNVYPDQTESYTLTNSAIYCIKTEFQRDTRSRSILIGAEAGYGAPTTLTKNVSITGNKIYNCKGIDFYKLTGGSFSNINVTGNTFYNIYGSVLANASGTNVVTSPNTVTTIANVPDPATTSNTGSTSSPLPSLAASPSPSPVYKSGDLNHDGSVNLFDFNLLISKFGNPYTIFDFNSIVSNYGK